MVTACCEVDRGLGLGKYRIMKHDPVIHVQLGFQRKNVQ